MTRQRAAVIGGRYVSWYEDLGPAKPSPRERGLQGAIVGKMTQKHPAAEVAKRAGDRLSR